MAATIQGIQVSFGVPSAVSGAIVAFVTAGIVENFQYTRGGNTAEIIDEDGDIVSRVDHGAKIDVSFDVICTTTTTVPAKGAVIAGLGTIDGINFGSDKTFVESVEVTYPAADVKKLSVSAVHYPSMVTA